MEQICKDRQEIFLGHLYAWVGIKKMSHGKSSMLYNLFQGMAVKDVEEQTAEHSLGTAQMAQIS